MMMMMMIVNLQKIRNRHISMRDPRNSFGVSVKSNPFQFYKAINFALSSCSSPLFLASSTCPGFLSLPSQKLDNLHITANFALHRGWPVSPPINV
jgi:hypothetical protein